jgi:hypothetical protein
MDVREVDRKGETVVGAKNGGGDKEGSGKKESRVAQGGMEGDEATK